MDNDDPFPERKSRIRNNDAFSPFYTGGKQDNILASGSLVCYSQIPC
jgi:hypothetical protein